jgi:hypothetical protein
MKTRFDEGPGGGAAIPGDGFGRKMQQRLGGPGRMGGRPGQLGGGGQQTLQQYMMDPRQFQQREKINPPNGPGGAFNPDDWIKRSPWIGGGGLGYAQLDQAPQLNQNGVQMNGPAAKQWDSNSWANAQNGTGTKGGGGIDYGPLGQQGNSVWNGSAYVPQGSAQPVMQPQKNFFPQSNPWLAMGGPQNGPTPHALPPPTGTGGFNYQQAPEMQGGPGAMPVPDGGPAGWRGAAPQGDQGPTGAGPMPVPDKAPQQATGLEAYDPMHKLRRSRGMRSFFNEE